MRILVSLPLVFFLALFPAEPAFAQTPPTSSHIANVYIQSNVGVYVYNADSQGRLTLVKGSAFADTGQMEAVQSSYLIAVGTNDLHSYHVESNGAVGSQASEIDTASYGGSDCGSTFGPTILDHTGKYFTVQLYGTEGGPGGYTVCSGLQTYKIESSGQFTFLGDYVSTLGEPDGAYTFNLTTYSSNDQFVYAITSRPEPNVISAFVRSTAGDLIADSNFSEQDPSPGCSGPYPAQQPWIPEGLAADPANHLAVVLVSACPNGGAKLASYTINPTTGAIRSTNTYANMPTVPSGDRISMSWGGDLLAAAGGGLQIFHFNGANPATDLGGLLLPGVEIDQIAWDKSNHLYALSYKSQKLYVYTVTSTNATEAPGSPYTLNGAYGYSGLLVVPTV